MKRKELFILLLLAGINFTNIVDFMVMMPLAPQFQKAFIMNTEQWSFVVSSYGFAAFLSGLLSIFFIDKVGRKKFLILAYTGFIIATFLCSKASSLHLLIAARILTGLFGGLIGTIVLSIVGDLIPLERRARAMGIVMIGFSAAAALGVPLGIYFADKFSWHVPFVAISIFASVLLLLSLITIPKLQGHLQNNDKPKVLEALKQIFGNKNRTRALLFFSVLIFGQFLVIPFLSPFLVENLDFTNRDLMYIYLAGGFCTIVSSPIIGRLSDKFGRKKVFNYLLVISSLPVYLLTTLSSKSLGYALFVSALFFVLVSGRIIPALSMVIATAESKIRGTFMSLRSSFQQLFSAAAAYVSGLIVVENVDGSYQHYDWTGYISILICLTTLLLVRFY